MKADLSRSTFAAKKHYRDVRWQMGRVPIDADFNEYVDIVAHRVETETIDVVGKCGGPIQDAAFQLAAAAGDLPPAQQAAAAALGALAPGDFLVSAGRYYVRGILCENEAPLKFSNQAAGDFPSAKPLDSAGLYLVYLDVWARHLTFLDDPLIREVALGGPDTTTRNKTVWQLKTVRVGNSGAPKDCTANFQSFHEAIAPGTGTLAAEVDPDMTSKKPCVLPPGGGYRRIENHLYRVEIHDGGSAGGAATFKWSRDNGAIVSAWETTSSATTIRLQQPPRDQVLGFAVGQWVELTDDTRELEGKPGDLFEVAQVDGDLLKLKTAVTPGIFVRNPKVRRWDSVSKMAVTTGAWLPLEDGVRVQFSAGAYKTGDYWMIPARTATANVEWPRSGGAAAFLPPHGIRHSYCRIGFVDFDGAKIVVHDCRNLFPPLTEIEDCCDLKLHNQHLHGKGVVCGLQVYCGGDAQRQTVRIQPGHAIDCNGADLLLKLPLTFAAAARAKELKLLDGQGNGDVLVTMKADAAGKPVFDLQAAPAEPVGFANVLKHLFEGTIWMDFHEHCLKPWLDFLQPQLITRDPQDKALVAIQEKRMLTVMNLFAHQSANAPNRRLWLSAEQHEMLRALYEGLIKIAGASKTFCGMNRVFPGFPKYPFAKFNIATGFAARRLNGLAVSSDNRTAVLWGDTSPAHLFVFDVAKGELVQDVAVEGASGLAIVDAVFTVVEKKPALAVLSGGDNQSVLTLLDPKKLTAVAAPLIFDKRSLVRIVAHSSRAGTLLAVERGAGVHVLDLATVSSGQLGGPVWKFNAAGHLTVEADRVCATVAPIVASGAPAAPGVYGGIIFGALGRQRDEFDANPVWLTQLDDRVRTGQDGLALAVSAGRVLLHVIANGTSARPAKRAIVVDAASRQRVSALELPLADDDSNATGPVTVAAFATGRVVYAFKNRNQLLWTNALAQELAPNQTLPAQAAPVALGHTFAAKPVLFAANQESMTLTVVPVQALDLKAVTDAELAAYRDALLEVFRQLVIAVAQRLKDCLCDHLLIDCPQCAAGETLPLAKMEIRANAVYHICNFERLEVLTFPKVKYWLSAVPLIPLLSFWVEKFCCSIFQRAPAGASIAPPLLAAAVSPEVILGTAKRVRAGKLQSTLASNLTWTKTAATHLVEELGRRMTLPKAVTKIQPIHEVLHLDPDIASAKLANSGITVAGVESYDMALAADVPALSIRNLPAAIRPGESVKLFTRGGKVTFYQLVRETAAPSAPAAAGGKWTGAVEVSELEGRFEVIRAQIDAVRTHQAAELIARDVELAKLKAAGEVLARELSARDQQLSELRANNARLAEEVTRLATTSTTPAAMVTQFQTTLETVKQELATLKQSNAEELAARDRQIAELRSANEKLTAEFTESRRKLETDISRLSRGRTPPQ